MPSFPRPVQRLGLALVLLAGAPAARAEEPPAGTLLANGGFEDVREVSEQDWRPFLEEGWILAGKPRLPAGWELGRLDRGNYRFPGTVEVAETDGEAREGRRCLRLSTPPVYWAHTTLSATFPAPPSRTVAWSFRAKGAGGEYVNSEHKSEGTPGRFFSLEFSHAGGTQLVPGRLRNAWFVPEVWTQYAGVVHLAGCASNHPVRLSLVVFQANANRPSTIWVDDVKLAEAPAPVPAPETRAAAAAAARPLVARKDYDLGAHWPLPLVCGQPFWFVQKDYLDYTLPRWRSLVERSARQLRGLVSLTPPDGTNPVPFIATGLRFGAGDFFDDWKRQYGGDPKPFVMQPRFAYDGIKDNPFAGWQSAPGLPQTLDLDLGRLVAIDTVRLYPGWQEGRQTECTVFLSADGETWEPVGAAVLGVNTPEGRAVSCAAQKARWVRTEVTQDSLGHAFLVEVEALDANGARLPVERVRFSSTAAPEAPPGAKPLVRRIEEAAAEHGERFIGIDLMEWDNDLFANGRSSWRKQGADSDRIRSLGINPDPPKTREEAVALIESMFRLVRETYGGGRLLAMNSLSIWDHYGLEFGSAAAYSEITGQYDERPRLRLAASRGAARQYGKPWIAYLVNACFFHGQVGMTSASLFYRELMLSIMAGCNLYEQESSGHYFKNRAPFLYLEPLLDADAFVRRHPDRGVPYTPIALGLDWLHGSARWGAVFYFLPMERPDRTIPVLGEMLLPSRPDATPEEQEQKLETDNWLLSNSPFGDVFDLLVLNPPSGSASLDKLSAYKVLVLLGEIRWTPPLAERVRRYVEGGGTLFCSLDQLARSPDLAWCGLAPTGKRHESRATLDAAGNRIAELPEGSAQPVLELAPGGGLETLYQDEAGRPLAVARSVGRGSVIACTVDALLDRDGAQPAPAARAVLQRLHDECLPVRVEGDIEFALNRTESSWLVTLINNRGVRKDPLAETTTEDMGRYARVTVTPRVPVRAANEWLADELMSVSAGENGVREAVVTVPPGGVRILELVTGP